MPKTANKDATAFVNGRAWRVKKGDALDDMPKPVQAAFDGAGIAKTAQTKTAQTKTAKE